MATQQSFNGDIRSVSPSREDYSSILQTQVRHSWGFVVKKMEALTKDDRDLTEDEKLRLQGASDIMTVEQTDPEAIRTQKYLWQIIHIGPQVYMLHVTGVNPKRLSIMVEPVREHILLVMRKNITDDRLNHSNIRKLTAKYGLDRLHEKCVEDMKESNPQATELLETLMESRAAGPGFVSMSWWDFLKLPLLPEDEEEDRIM